MSGKRVGICKRKKSEICNNIPKHCRRKMKYPVFCIYKIIYEKQLGCQARRLCAKCKKVRKLHRSHSSFFASNQSKKAGILYGVLFTSGETPL